MATETAIVFDVVPERLKADALAWPERVRALRITDTDSYRAAGELLKDIKALRDQVVATFAPNIKRWVDGHRAALREKGEHEAPLVLAERLVKDAIVAYDAEQERQRRAVEREEQELAERAAYQELLEEAAALERQAHDTGDAALLAEAQALIAAPPVVPTVLVPTTTPKLAGVGFRETWSARVVDKQRLVQYVASRPEFLHLLDVNQPAVNALARALKQELKVPGLAAVKTRDVAARR